MFYLHTFAQVFKNDLKNKHKSKKSMMKSLLFKVVFLFVGLVGFTTVASAQVTTSSIIGTIRDSKESLPGASVKAVHTPTGTSYGVTANPDGRFAITNARVGGPYTIEVSFVGYKTQTASEVYLKLGEPFVLDVILEDNSSTLETVSIVASARNPLLNSNRNGAATTINRATIQNLPSITRSVNDITRLTPQGGGPRGSIGGGNYRQNNFTVDGSDFNNQFGIGENIPANGAPISLDALEQISVSVTPYDVLQSGFIGGAVNAVTRSGTNKFFGTAFYQMRGDDQQGSYVGDVRVNKQNLAIKQYGASFGGPIIKDKLFFFVNAEFNKETRPGQNKVAATPELPFGPSTLGRVSKATATQLDEIKGYLLSRYGYDPGVYQGYSNLSNNDKLLARLDWNISKNHSFNLRYNQVESKSPSFVSTSRSPFGNHTQNRQGNIALHFSNSNYFQDANLYSVAAELNSKLSDKTSNTLRGSFTHQNDPRSSNSAIFPLVDILDPTESGTAVLTSFGYEPFTFGNLRDVQTYSITDNLNMLLGKHSLTLGAKADFSTTKNGFQRFGTSYYTFASWQDFVDSGNPAIATRPLDYGITYSLSPGYEQAFGTFKFAQYSAYLQDAITVSNKFKLTLGLRAELSTYPSVPEIKTHPLVANLDFGGEKINTGVLPESKIMLLPRLGFNWDVNGDRSLQLRGGSGMFAGKVPFVWIVAQSGDAGLIQFTQTSSGNQVPGPFNPDPRAYLPATPPAAGTSIPSTISAISPTFKNPQTWKSSLAADFKLPGGIVGTVEGIYNKDINAAVGRNLNLRAPSALNVTGYPDTRPVFPNSVAGRQYNSLNNGLVTPTATGAFTTAYLDNASEGGYYYSVSGQLSKTFNNGLSSFIAYTYSDGRNYGNGDGDQLLNLWSIPQTQGNSNIASLGYNANILPSRLIANIAYKKEYFGNLATSISVFYEGGIQGRFSYVYGGDFNRDGQTNDLIYIPRDASEITFAPLTVGSGASARTISPQEQSDAFFRYVAQDKYLSKNMGKIADRNGAKMPWRNQFDLRITQEVFKNVGGTKNSFQFTMDVFNLGNLLNKNWGAYKSINSTNILVPANQNAMGGATRPTFRLATFNNDLIKDTFRTNETISSTYYMQFGVRYNFQ